MIFSLVHFIVRIQYTILDHTKCVNPLFMLAVRLPVCWISAEAQSLEWCSTQARSWANMWRIRACPGRHRKS